MREIHSHKWWRKRLFCLIAGFMVVGFLFLMGFAASVSDVATSIFTVILQIIGLIFLVLIFATFFPPSKFTIYIWKFSRRHVTYSRVSLAPGEMILDTDEGIFFLTPNDIHQLSKSSCGLIINGPDGSIHLDTMDDWDGTNLDEGKQETLYRLLTSFLSRIDFKPVFNDYARPLIKLKTRYFLGVLLPLCVFAGLVFTFTYDPINPVVFKSLILGSGVFLAYDYRRRTRALMERIANQAEHSTE